MLLLNWRVWVAIALTGLLAFTHITVYKKGRHDVQIAWDEARARADSESRKLEQERQRGVDDAARTAAADQARILADAASARRDADGLRNDLDAANRYASESRSAAERVAKLSTELLGECANRYLDVAEQAQRADAEARELRRGWPK